MCTHFRLQRMAMAVLVTGLSAAGAAVAQDLLTAGEFRIDGGAVFGLNLNPPADISNPNPPPLIASNESSLDATVNSTGMSIGPHKLETRFYDAGGATTAWFRRWFEVSGPQYIKAAEYYIDTDPGEGNGTAISAPMDGSWNGAEELLRVSGISTSALTVGPHIAYVRAKDQDGLWSKPRPVPFEVAQPLHMVAAEWVMVNTGTAYDPANPPIAYGSGTPMAAADGVFDEQEEAVTWSGPALYRVRGYDIYVRCQDSLGRWSSYWWDPGQVPTPSLLQVGPSLSPDIDQDGLANYFEDMYGFNNLDPTDGDTDCDNDGLTNREEFQLESNPMDPNGPASTYYVSSSGADLVGGGSFSAPWQTISYAIGRILAAAPPSETAPARIFVMPGIYEETFIIPEWVTVIGALDGAVVLRGQYSGSNHSGLAHVRLEAPADVVTLLTVPDAGMDVRHVIFSGTSARQALGIVSSGAAVENTIITDCQFSGLSVAIDITGALPRILRSVFENLSGNAIVIHAGTEKAGLNSLGDISDPNSGWNRFVITTIDGYVIRNLSGQTIQMQNNDWDSDDQYEVDDAIAGPATFLPCLAKGSGLIVGAICCVIWDDTDANYTRITNATVSLTPSTYPPVTANYRGVYTFGAIMPGVYTVDVTAAGYQDMTLLATVPAGKTLSLMFPMHPSTPEGEGEGVLEGEGAIEGEGAAEGEGAVEGEGEPEGSAPPIHTADQDNDGKISLTELLRVIQFFNFRSYHCQSGTEDQYAPGLGDHSCAPHAADYNPADWQVSLTELLRLIQFFNMRGYHVCSGTEDGYCPGPA